jgi:hypothetical protein
LQFPITILLMVVLFASVSSATTIAGRVTDVTGTSAGGIHVKLKTDSGVVEACLGPRQFLADNNSLPRIGDQIEVKGENSESFGEKLLVAYELRRGGRTLVLRGGANSSASTTATPVHKCDHDSHHQVGHHHQGHE